jgi:hypothetical protein
MSERITERRSVLYRLRRLLDGGRVLWAMVSSG